jgi:hypothetical protein
MKVQTLNDQLKIKIPEFSKFPHVRSNVSIVHYADNIYFLTYRLFVPDKRVKVNNVPIPWKSKWRNNVDTTVFCLAKRNKSGTFKILSEEVILPSIFMNEDQSIVDTRIFKTKDGIFNISFNTWTQTPTGTIRSDLKKACFGSWNCTYVAKATLLLDKTDGIKVSKFVYPCLNTKIVMPRSNRCYDGQREEKNWVYWYTNNNEEMISYFVEPHIVMKAARNNNTCKVVAETNGNSLKKIKELYPSMNFLLGTPPIRYSKNEYIAVGHMKYNYKRTDVLNESHLNNKVLHFNKACNPEKPGHLIYMMFFYTFKATSPYNITRVGHCFIPPNHGQYMLPFPMGLTTSNDSGKYIVSYGEADRYVKLLTLTKNEIEKMLMDYNNLDVNKYKFMVL